MNTFLQSCFYKYISLLLITVFSFSFSFSQVKFSAICDAKKIGKNDYLQIDFSVENGSNVQDITPPDFRNFSVISGPNQQSSMTSINGKVTQSISISFVLKPLATGAFTISSATAKVDGKEYHSDPVSIQVTNSSAPNKPGGNSISSPFGNMTLDFPTEPQTYQFDDYILRKGENADEKIKRNLFIKANVNKTTCYVGEPIIATYKLYTRLKSESNVLKTPSFNGFSVSELQMPDNNTVTTEKYNGREYNVYTLRKVQLYPLQSGRLSLEPVEVENKITFLKAGYAGKKNGNVFYDMLRDFADESAPANTTQLQTITIANPPISITVKPLPEAYKPASFKGAVGDFKIDAGVDKNNITTDDAGNLKVVINGTGNLQMINSPHVSWPDGMEGFEPKSAESIDKFSVPMKGGKVFTYPFTVSKPGSYIIPSLEFSYFDINTKSYKTINTKPLNINVEKGTGNNQRINGEEKNNKPGEDFYDVMNNYRWYFISGILLLSALIFLLAKNKKKELQTTSIKNISKEEPQQPIAEAPQQESVPFKPLADAEEKLLENNASQFYKTVDVSLKNYLSQKLNVPVEELTNKKMNERLDKCNVGVGTSLLLNDLLKEIELNLYAPVSSETQMAEVYEKASEVISLLDKQIC
jgi:hypothetical protein